MRVVKKLLRIADHSMISGAFSFAVFVRDIDDARP